MKSLEDLLKNVKLIHLIETDSNNRKSLQEQIEFLQLKHKHERPKKDICLKSRLLSL